MIDPDEDGKYEGTYTAFTLHGTYRILIYAKESQGTISLPRQTTVVQNGGIIPPNNPPVAESMTFNTDEDIAIQETLSAGDADHTTRLATVADIVLNGGFQSRWIDTE